MKSEYDFLIVGTGLFGATFAYEANKRGKSCLLIDRRSHIAGNVYTERILNINVHKYGAHIFHTNNKKIWDYLNGICEFNNFINAPLAYYKGDLYNLPFNMNTFYKLWKTLTPKDAMEKIQNQIKFSSIESPQNLEEKAISLVGYDIYNKLIRGYTEKQWGRSCDKIPSFIIERIPLRFTFNNNYFNDSYQGIPRDGYTQMVRSMLEGSDILLNTEYKKFISNNENIAKKTIYTGTIDEFFNYCLGALQYRSIDFVIKKLEVNNFQGNAVVNYTDADIPYTRIIEHKHFESEPLSQKNTVLSYEYPMNWEPGKEAYYPINDEENNALYKKYLEMSKDFPNIIFGGRLGLYKYLDMDKTIELALELVEKLL